MSEPDEMIQVVQAQIRKWCEHGCVYPQTCRCRKMAIAAVDAVQKYLSGLPLPSPPAPQKNRQRPTASPDGRDTIDVDFAMGGTSRANQGLVHRNTRNLLQRQTHSRQDDTGP